MHLLDTDTLTHFQSGHGDVADHIRRMGVANVATTIITAIEVLRGRHAFVLKAATGNKLVQAAESLRRSEQLLSSLRIIPIDRMVADWFDELQQNRKPKSIGRADLLIACITLAHDATVVTRSVRHFRQVPGLIVENWVDRK
jgi:tRNA(fMet)-specific endonuclease VapC